MIELDTDNVEPMRQLLVQAFEEKSGLRVRTKTIQSSSLEAALKPAPSFREVRENVPPLLPSYGLRGRKIA